MSGISGIVNSGGENFNLPFYLQKMNAAIRHRGLQSEGFLFHSTDALVVAGSSDTPDSAWQSGISYKPTENITGIHNSFSLGLGHRNSHMNGRAYNHQPSCYLNGQYWIVFDGIINNKEELRKKLEGKQHKFLFDTDQEILLAAYAEWGDKMPEQLDGSWALAIFNTESKELFCSRDRLGIKPFYYFITHDFFCFASEQKALLQLPFVNTSLNTRAAFDYLAFGITEEEDEGMFRKIKELQPGHFLSYDPYCGCIRLREYYHLKFCKEHFPFSGQEQKKHIENIKNLLGASVNSASEVACPNVPSNALIAPENDNQEDFENMIYTQDIPVISPAVYIEYLWMKKVASTGTKTIKEWTGIQELFGGADHHYTSFIRELIANGRYLDTFKAFYRASVPKGSILKAFLKETTLLNKVQKNSTEQYLQQDFLKINRPRIEHLTETRRNNLNEQLYFEYTGTRLKSSIRQTDRNAARHSIECLQPLMINASLTEYIFQIPSVYKIKNQEHQIPLREAVEGMLRLNESKYHKNDLYAFQQKLLLKLSQEIDLKDLNGLINLRRVISNRRILIMEQSDFFWRIIALAYWKKLYKI